jgi:hypothetical protein
MLGLFAPERRERIGAVGRPRSGNDTRLALESDVDGDKRADPAIGPRCTARGWSSSQTLSDNRIGRCRTRHQFSKWDRTFTLAILSSSSASRFSSSDFAVVARRDR